MATQTFRDFMTECECYEYSQENYNLMKEAYEIDLMEQYLENQAFALENADVINTEDGYTFTEGMFVEASAIDMEKNNLLLEEVEQKKAGFFKKIWEGFKTLIGKIISFLKKLITAKKKDNNVSKEIQANGGAEAVAEYADAVENEDNIETADSNDAATKIHNTVGKDVKKVEKPGDNKEKYGNIDFVGKNQPKYEVPKTKKDEVEETVSAEAEPQWLKIYNEEKKKSRNPHEAWFNTVQNRIFAKSSRLAEFFSSKSRRSMSYQVVFAGNMPQFLKSLEGVASIKLNIRNHKPDSIFLTFDAVSKVLSQMNLKYLQQSSKSFMKDGIIYKISDKYVSALIGELENVISEADKKLQDNTKISNNGTFTWDSKSSEMQQIVLMVHKAVPEQIELLNALNEYCTAFLAEASKQSNDVAKRKAKREKRRANQHPNSKKNK